MLYFFYCEILNPTNRKRDSKKRTPYFFGYGTDVKEEHMEFKNIHLVLVFFFTIKILLEQ